MKNKVLKICLAFLFIALIVFPTMLTTVTAAINETYSDEIGKSNTEDEYIEKKVGQSVIMDALGIFVYAVASIIENLVGNIFYSMTQSTDFPWADRIIFNAIPLLDVNFFNASEGSFFKSSSGDDTALAKVIRNTYFSVLAIAIAFLTIVIGIAAAKMALSTLATEKAKYKEAVTKWMSSIILIFLMHNLMAFIFYLNEGLVEVASSILVKNMDSSTVAEDLKKHLTITSDEDMQKAVENFFDDNPYLWVGPGTDPHPDGAGEILADEEKTKLAAEFILDDDFQNTCLKYSTEDGFFGQVGQAITAVPHMTAKLAGITDQPNAGSGIVFNAIDDVQGYDLEFLKAQKDYWNSYKGTEEKKAWKFEDDFELSGSQKFWTTHGQINEAIKFYKVYWNKCYDMKLRMYNADGEFIGNNNDSDNEFDIIGNMASYFKIKAWTFNRDEEGNLKGWKNSKIQVIGALLYAIFVMQSILYFFSYVKRFFYIVILAILAPVVVLFDFLGKAVS